MSTDLASAKHIVRCFPTPPQKIACGFYHSAGIVRDNQSGTTSAYTWGRNQHNVLGLCSSVSPENGQQTKQTDKSDVPIHIEAFGDDVYEVACGNNHTVILKKRKDDHGGHLFAAGLGNRGRLGMKAPGATIGSEDVEDTWSAPSSDVQGKPVPIKIHSPYSGTRVQVLRVACGGDHTICFATDSSLYAWGANGEGQCGLGHSKDVRCPAPILTLKDREILHFAAGAEHSLACVGDGEVWSWGCARNGRLGLGAQDNVKEPTFVSIEHEAQITVVAAGEAHSGGLTTGGVVLMWGAGSYGRLGHGEENDVPVPKIVNAFEEMGDNNGNVTLPVRMIALGGFHSLFLAENKKIYACGCGAPVGLVSEGDLSIILVPRQVTDSKVFQHSEIMQMCAGVFHNLLLLKSGELVTWGIGAYGCLGDGVGKNLYEPKVIHVMPATQTTFFCCDSGGKKALFDRSERKARDIPKSMDTHGRSQAVWEVKTFACGSMHTVALTNGGHVYVWGCHSNGQLGLGANIEQTYIWTPRELIIGQGRLVKEVAAGYDHCIAVTHSQELWAWGSGTSGQLGTGYARDQLEPVLVSQLTQVLHCGAGEEHSAAIVKAKRKGTHHMYTWGNAEGGRLGLGEDFMSGPQSAPSEVIFPWDAKSMAGNARDSKFNGPLMVRCGQSHTVAICGKELPDPNEEPPPKGKSDKRTLKPTSPDDIKNEVWSWGTGWYGRLGHGDSMNAYSPKQVKLGDVSARDVAVGAFHTCMVSVDRDLWVWGQASMVCEPDDQANPKKFRHIEGNPEVKIVACGEMHTIVITVTGDMWVWGDNKFGQLSIETPKPTAPELAKPALGPIRTVATGTCHSIACFHSGETCAWGNQSCGRLGLQDKQKDKVIFTPKPVYAVWASIESMSKGGENNAKTFQVNDDVDSESEKETAPTASQAAPTAAQPVPTPQPEMAKVKDSTQDRTTKDSQEDYLKNQTVEQFSTMQSLLTQEPRWHQEDELHRLEDKINGQMHQIMDAIREIPQLEKDLESLESEIEQRLLANLSYFPATVPPETGSDPVSARIMALFPVYEELIWVLQQQTRYLAQLSVTVTRPDEKEVFCNIVDTIYGDSAPRTRHLFLMMLRLMVNKEIEKAESQIDNVFDKKTSQVFHVFANYALSEHHYKDLVHLYLKASSPQAVAGENHSDTLLLKVRAASDTEQFALTIEDYKKNVEDPNKSEQDLNQDFTGNCDKFREFLVQSFLDAVTRVNLPRDIRQVMGHILQQVSNQSFPLGQLEAGITQELKKCEPLLRLFCQGILVPMFQNLQKFANKECFLRHSWESVIKTQMGGNTVILSNFQQIADFLESMCTNVWKSKTENRILLAASKTLKIELLKYLKKQAEEVDDLDRQMMLDTYLSHFDRSRHTVMMSTVNLMKMSNLLKKHINKLRIMENDSVERNVQKIPTWQQQDLDNSKAHDHMHNFFMNVRFLFTHKDVVLCKDSRCLMPSQLVGTVESKSLVSVFQGEDEESPRKVLEKLFRDRELETFTSKKFPELQVEFEVMRSNYKQKSPPDYDRMQLLQRGIRMIEELNNLEARPKDVLDLMKVSLVERARHYRYLQAIEENIDTINSRKKEYMMRINTKGVQHTELKQALDRSMDFDMPQFLKNQSGLYFVKIAESMTGLKDAKQLRELGCSSTPMATYSVPDLKKKKVLDSVNPKFAEMQKNMKITFRVVASGGVDMAVNIVTGGVQNNVKQLSVSEETLQEMKRADKSHKVELRNNNEDVFLTVMALKFVDLVSDLSKS